jgi:uncharacterized protein YoxC
LFEQNNKLKADNLRLKNGLNNKQIEVDELIATIKLMAASDKALHDLKRQIDESNRTILALRNQVDSLMTDANESALRNNDQAGVFASLQLKVREMEQRNSDLSENGEALRKQVLKLESDLVGKT